MPLKLYNTVLIRPATLTHPTREVVDRALTTLTFRQSESPSYQMPFLYVESRDVYAGLSVHLGLNPMQVQALVLNLQGWLERVEVQPASHSVEGQLP